MMLTSVFVSFVSYLDACLDAVGVRPPLDRAATAIGNDGNHDEKLGKT
jgi:hypothetical protein